MKKILLATTVLAAGATAAAAEVSVSGSGRMGVVYNSSIAAVPGTLNTVSGGKVTVVEGTVTADDIQAARAKVAAAQNAVSLAPNAAALKAAEALLADAEAELAARLGTAGTDSTTQFSSRIRISFTASGETDGGLSFGASVRNDQSGVGNTANGDSTVFISGAFGKLTMGDVSGAADAIVGQVSGVGYTSLGSTNEIGYLGNTKTAALYTYSTGDLTLGLGIGQTNSGDDAKSVAVKYAMGDYSVALGYEDVTGDSQLSAMGTATFGDFAVALKAANRDSALDNAYAMSVDYTMGAATVTAFATQNYDFAGNDSMGLGVAYDLGGGAKIKGGVVDNGANTVADLGLNLSF
jgi:outer membrane protein OmpU